MARKTVKQKDTAPVPATPVFTPGKFYVDSKEQPILVCAVGVPGRWPIVGVDAYGDVCKFTLDGRDWDRDPSLGAEHPGWITAYVTPVAQPDGTIAVMTQTTPDLPAGTVPAGATEQVTLVLKAGG